MSEENQLEQPLTEAEQAAHDEQIAVKILGGFGVRNHMGDINYALMIGNILTELVKVDQSDIECMIVVAKVRCIEDMEDASKDKFHVVGGIVGSELELTALHALVAARIRAFRATIAEKLAQNNGESNGN